MVGDDSAALTDFVPGKDQHDMLTYRLRRMGVDPVTGQHGVAGQLCRRAAGIDDCPVLFARAEALVPARRDDGYVRNMNVCRNPVPHRDILVDEALVWYRDTVLLRAAPVVVVARRH